MKNNQKNPLQLRWVASQTGTFRGRIVVVTTVNRGNLFRSNTIHLCSLFDGRFVDPTPREHNPVPQFQQKLNLEHTKSSNEHKNLALFVSHFNQIQYVRAFNKQSFKIAGQKRPKLHWTHYMPDGTVRKRRPQRHKEHFLPGRLLTVFCRLQVI